MTALLALMKPTVHLAMMVFTLMPAHARIVSITAMFALPPPTVRPVQMVMKTALPPVTPVQMVITEMLPTAIARIAATIVRLAMMEPAVTPVRLALD
jgi:hypothetical protein